jgi:hypothetical protein
VLSGARFVFQAEADGEGPASFLIEIEDDAAPLTYGPGTKPDGRLYLGQSIQWSDVEPWQAGQTYESPDVSALIEALLDAQNTDLEGLAFRITGSGSRQAYSSDSDGEAPILLLDFADTPLL